MLWVTPRAVSAALTARPMGAASSRTPTEVDHQGAVFGHDRVEMVLDLGEHGAQLAHDPPGDQDHPDPLGARLSERGQRVGGDRALRQGAIEVGRHRPEVTARSLGHALDQQPVGLTGTAEREHLLAVAGVDDEGVEPARADGSQGVPGLIELAAQFLQRVSGCRVLQRVARCRCPRVSSRHE